VAFTALFDSCVLYPAPLCGLVIRLGCFSLFRARWSDQIHKDRRFRIVHDWTNPAPAPTPTPTPSRNGVTTRTGHTFDGLAERLETSQAYLDERRDVLPVFTDRYKLSAENASSIAQSMVKIGYTLNGGALIAIPTIVNLFTLRRRRHSGHLCFPVLAFFLIQQVFFCCTALRCLQVSSGGNRLSYDRVK